MVELSRRLRTAASMVSSGNRVADIGCDHAHTSIYLVQCGISHKIIAMDIHKGPLARAAENVERYGCGNFIELRLSDGADRLKPGEVDTILISGMGGPLIIRILENCTWIKENKTELVLQPQSEIPEVRHFLHNSGYCIRRESMLKEGGKYYTVLKAVPGEEHYEKKVWYQYGRLLLEERNESLRTFLEYGREKYQGVLNTLKNQEHGKNRGRIEELERELLLMEEALAYYPLKKEQ